MSGRTETLSLRLILLFCGLLTGVSQYARAEENEANQPTLTSSEKEACITALASNNALWEQEFLPHSDQVEPQVKSRLQSHLQSAYPKKKTDFQGIARFLSVYETSRLNSLVADAEAVSSRTSLFKGLAKGFGISLSTIKEVLHAPLKNGTKKIFIEIQFKNGKDFFYRTACERRGAFAHCIQQPITAASLERQQEGVATEIFSYLVYPSDTKKHLNIEPAKNHRFQFLSLAGASTGGAQSDQNPLVCAKLFLRTQIETTFDRVREKGTLECANLIRKLGNEYVEIQKVQNSILAAHKKLLAEKKSNIQIDCPEGFFPDASQQCTRSVASYTDPIYLSVTSLGKKGGLTSCISKSSNQYIFYSCMHPSDDKSTQPPELLLRKKDSLAQFDPLPDTKNRFILRELARLHMGCEHYYFSVLHGPKQTPQKTNPESLAKPNSAAATPSNETTGNKPKQGPSTGALPAIEISDESSARRK